MRRPQGPLNREVPLILNSDLESRRTPLVQRAEQALSAIQEIHPGVFFHTTHPRSLHTFQDLGLNNAIP